MKKELIIILIAFLFLMFLSKKSKAAPPTTETPLGGSGDGHKTSGLEFKTVIVQSGDTWFKIVKNNWDWAEAKGEPTQENVLNFTKQNAIANGFDWALYDNIATSNVLDPDFLKPNQKLRLFKWWSFAVNNPDGLLQPNEVFDPATFYKKRV